MNWKLETKRLYLREFIIEDAKQMFSLNAVKEQIEYTGDEAFSSVEAAKQFLKSYSDYKNNGCGRWACITKETQDWIGWCGLKRHEDGVVDIGYRFFKEYWGQGYATESARACLQYGFDVLGLEEIIGRSAKDNAASIRVLEKIGLQFWKEEDADHIENAQIYKIDKPKIET